MDRRADTGRWLQFRLSSLLLLPLLVGLTYTLSDQVFDHFLLVNAGYGAVFGTIWGIGPMRIDKPQGASRAVSIARAAMVGGMTAGILAGPAILAIAIWWSRYSCC